jgi:iron transport multicopper oxidase
MGQYPDGLWGPLIVHDPNPPFHYDEEFTLTLSDWYHEEMSDMINTYQSPAGEASDGAPTPSGGALINSKKNFTINVKPNKTYLIHVICPGNFPGHAWLFDQHPMTTVEIDGVYVDPVDVNTGTQQARIAPGQRQSVLIFNKGNFPPVGYDNNATGWLVYNKSAPLPPAPILHSLGNSDFFDDIDYVPADHEPILEPVTHQLILNTAAMNISDISR